MPFTALIPPYETVSPLTSSKGASQVGGDYGRIPAHLRRALDNGLVVAEDFRRRGLIAASALFLAGEARISGAIALAAPNKHHREEFAHA